MDNLGIKIRELRKKSGDSQKELGHKIGYSYGGLAKIERGERKPSIDLLNKIARVYDVPITHWKRAGNTRGITRENRMDIFYWRNGRKRNNTRRTKANTKIYKQI